MVVPSLRLKKIARTSVPSITAPPLIVSPIPAPRKNPPKIATSKLSFVMSGKFTSARQIARPEMASVVLTANTFPRTLFASIINGIFILIIRMGRGNFVSEEVSSEMPVTPPSMN